MFPWKGISDTLWLDLRHCKFYLTSSWIFLYSYKSPRALFLDASNFLRNSFILSSLAFMMLGSSKEVFNLGLIIPHHWGKIFLSPVSNDLRITSVSSLPGWISHWNHPVWMPDLVPYNPFEWLFPQSWAVSSHRCTAWHSVDCSRKTLCRSPEFSLQLSPLWYSVLRTPAVLVSTDSQLCLFNSRALPGSAWVPLPEQWPGQSLQAVSWGIHLICFLFLRGHCPSFPLSIVLKTVVSHILSSCIVVSGKKVSLVSVASSWLEAEVLSHNFVKLAV